MKLNICIDIDGTITDPYYWLKYINEYFKSDLKPEGLVKFDVCRVLNIPEEDYDVFYDLKGEQIHRDCVPRPYAKEVIKELSKQHNIYFVTARPEKYREVSQQWLDDNGFVGELFMVGGHDKVGQAKELNCDYFIEDRYRNAVKLAQADINVFLIDTNYNRYPLIDNMKRVNDWMDIKREFNTAENIAS